MTTVPVPGRLVRRTAASLRATGLKYEMDWTWKVGPRCGCEFCQAGTHVIVTRVGLSCSLHIAVKDIEPIPVTPDAVRA